MRELLIRLLIQREEVDRFINLLADRVLTRVLLLLRPEEHYRVQRVAETLAAAFPIKGLPLLPGRVRRLKWQFIFRYLLEGGRGFDHRDFIRRFAAFAAQETGQGESETYLALLTQQLATNILPSTRELNLEVLQALTGDYGASGGETRDEVL